MQSDARAFLKQKLPPQVKGLFQMLREAVAPPPIDDIALAEYAPVRDPDPTPRLTLVLPMLQKGSDFGGTVTGIDIFCRLGLALSEYGPIDLRVLITDVLSETDPSIITGRAAKAGVTLADDQIEMVRTTRAAISVRANEIFMPYNWWVTLNFAQLRDAQTAMFGGEPRPLVWLMQDYEPGFSPFNSAHLLARAAYDTCEPLWGIINSTNLANYIEHSGHRFERSFVFEPVISDALRSYLDRVGTSVRAKRVLVYGRPNVPRNCFPALIRGLRRWARDYPQFADWEVISAGVAHDPVDLGDGRKLTSVGKLSLDDYAEMLLTSAAGVSLMASPHPSYPPLEMAHFGVRTVTNSYACKDLSTFHPGITSVNSVAERPLAAALAAACEASAQPAETYRDPAYIRTDDYPFLPDLAQAVYAVLGGPAAA